METEATMKNLAWRYFKGEITPEEAAKLYEFVQQGDNRSLFRQWEAEWDGAEPSADTLHCLELLKSEMDDDTAAIVPIHSRRTKVMKWVAIAACALLLIGLSTLMGMKLSEGPETYVSVSAPVGNRSQVVLPDGSTVWLNAGTSLRYANDFTHNRNVYLDGEAYFEVTKHDGQEFRVCTKGYDVVVRGTKFDVSAYNDENEITTSLLEGRVDVERGEKLMTMRPGESVTLNLSTGKLTKTMPMRHANAWVNGNAEFENISLGNLAKQLSRRYGVNVRVISPQLSKVCFTISLRHNETLDHVLKTLSEVEPMTIVRDSTGITLK